MEQTTTKDRILGFARTILAAGGAFLVGYNFLGTAINETVWQEIVGSVIVAGTLVWSIADKTATIEKLESGVKQIVLWAAGFFVAKGKITADTAITIAGFASLGATYLFGLFNRKKAQALADPLNPLKVADLKK